MQFTYPLLVISKQFGEAGNRKYLNVALQKYVVRGGEPAFRGLFIRERGNNGPGTVPPRLPRRGDVPRGPRRAYKLVPATPASLNPQLHWVGSSLPKSPCSLEDPHARRLFSKIRNNSAPNSVRVAPLPSALLSHPKEGHFPMAEARLKKIIIINNFLKNRYRR